MLDVAAEHPEPAGVADRRDQLRRRVRDRCLLAPPDAAPRPGCTTAWLGTARAAMGMGQPNDLLRRNRGRDRPPCSRPGLGNQGSGVMMLGRAVDSRQPTCFCSLRLKGHYPSVRSSTGDANHDGVSANQRSLTLLVGCSSRDSADRGGGSDPATARCGAVPPPRSPSPRPRPALARCRPRGGCGCRSETAPHRVRAWRARFLAGGPGGLPDADEFARRTGIGCPQ